MSKKKSKLTTEAEAIVIQYSHVEPIALAERLDLDRVHLDVQAVSEHLKAHEHDKVPCHEHPDLCEEFNSWLNSSAAGTAREIKDVQRGLRAELRGAIRALLAVLEAGHLNSEQVKAIHAVRVVIGDAHGTGCRHELTVYEIQGGQERLVCQSCRAVIQ